MEINWTGCVRGCKNEIISMGYTVQGIVCGENAQNRVNRLSF